jgi:hypothetical protein
MGGSRTKSLQGLVILALLGSFTAAPAEERYGEKTVSVQVTDQKGKPLRGIPVELWTKAGDVALKGRTNGKGRLAFKHMPTEKCFLEVIPPVKRKLASAIVEDISGDESRSVLVSLRPGCLVTGRVLAAPTGKGLKDVLIKVFAEEHKTEHTARVHGGGAVNTGGGGEFQLVLTPGKKHLVVLNKRYNEVGKRLDAKVNVIEDMRIADIELPARKTGN